MSCTNYDAAINYNAPINYNGVCVSPPVSGVVGGGYVRHDYHRERPRKTNDDIAIVLALLELTDDDY
jgi:hypothetical protein